MSVLLRGFLSYCFLNFAEMYRNFEFLLEDMRLAFLV